MGMRTKGCEVYTHINPGRKCSIKATAPIKERKNSPLHAIWLIGAIGEGYFRRNRSKPLNLTGEATDGK